MNFTFELGNLLSHLLKVSSLMVEDFRRWVEELVSQVEQRELQGELVRHLGQRLPLQEQLFKIERNKTFLE